MENLHPNWGLIDLHLHLDGSLSVSSVRELAAMAAVPVPDSDEELLEKLQVSGDCRDLNEYLEKFDFPCSLMQTEEAVSAAVYNLLEELKSQGLLYAEIRFAPQLHTLRGLTQTQVVRAAVTGLKRSDFKANLILCCMRGRDNGAANLETLQVAAKFLGKGVCAADLAGAEALFPTESFMELFQIANEKKIPLTIHAGEAAGPESVWAALKCGARRIGHGVRSLEDPVLMARLAQSGTVLEVCPTSNLNTNIFPDMPSYPLRKLMAAGIKVTVNTDNMTVSGVTLRSEMDQMIKTFDLTEKEVRGLLHNSAEGSFAETDVKAWLHDRIDTANSL